MYPDVSLFRMRIAVTDYSTLEEVLRAVEEVPYEGGNSRTGLALEFLVESVFSPSIVRDNSPKVWRFNHNHFKTPSCLTHLWKKKTLHCKGGTETASKALHINTKDKFTHNQSHKGDFKMDLCSNAYFL